MESLRRLGAVHLATTMATYRQVLRLHQEAINALNVYPVPDGDTGTNMALTVESVVAELAQIEGLAGLDTAVGSSPEYASSKDGAPSMQTVCGAVAHGSLMGARGNSGVILSQLLRGLTAVLADSGEEISEQDVARALDAASDAARRAVLRPVEGTILTVARAAADGAQTAAAQNHSLVATVAAARRAAAAALARTPEQLPVLARAGVVDAGGAGYLLLLDAVLTVLDGRPLPSVPRSGGTTRHAVVAQELPGASLGAEDFVGEDDLRYEVMYLLEARDDTMGAFKEVWAGIGDSIVVVGGDGLFNCHIHTNDVGAAIEAALDAGRPRNIRVTDLAGQIDEERWVREGARQIAEVAEQTPHRTAVVAVATGEGIGRIFRSLGVHYLVPGGQSMNPSTAQILDVIEQARSDEVVLLPNNDNVHPVAMQVCELANKTVRVVPTSGIVEGFAALLEYDPEAGAEDNARAMAESARRVVAGEVTRAVRDAAGPAGPICRGDWMGLSRDGVEVVGESIEEAACGLLGKLLRDDHELVTLIEGEGAGVGETRRVTEWLAEHRPDLAVEVHHGGQPLYPFLLSIE